jgi:two-component system, oxyanion-binding sensor
MSLHPVSAAFMPLTDSLVLVAAAALGFAENEGIALKLTRETSWANVRDRMAVGHFDVAHMLAPMPVAFNLGLSPLSLKVIAPFALGLGGNAVTVSTALHAEMRQLGGLTGLDPAAAGKTLKTIIKSRSVFNRPRLVFAVVHPHSGHNFELRYWLSACGINPETDVDIVIVPPPLMPDALAAGRIDAFCVGEPWNSVAVATGHGVIATAKSKIWRSSPEKVLGVSAEWAERNPDLLAALLRALYKAAKFCGQSENRPALAALLAKPEFIGVNARLIEMALSGHFSGAQNGNENPLVIDGFFMPFARAATFPWQSHAAWFYSQMVRWGQIAHSNENALTALKSYRPDLYRAALAPLTMAIPETDLKIEGGLQVPTLQNGLLLGPDGFFDGQVFDPAFMEAYIASQTALF